MSNVDTLVNILCDDLQEGNDDQGTKGRVMNMLKMVILNEFFPFFLVAPANPVLQQSIMNGSRPAGYFLSQGKLNVDTAVVYSNMFAYCKENIGCVFIDFDIDHDVEEKLSVQDYNDMKLVGFVSTVSSIKQFVLENNGMVIGALIRKYNTDKRVQLLDLLNEIRESHGNFKRFNEPGVGQCDVSVKHLTPDELIAKKILEDYDLALEKLEEDPGKYHDFVQILSNDPAE